MTHRATETLTLTSKNLTLYSLKIMFLSFY